MKIIHQIHGVFSKHHQASLARYGISVKVGFDGFEIEENEIYVKIKGILPESNFNDAYGTLFDQAEIESAEYLVARPVWASNGYPMPDDDFGYFKGTYGEGNICKSCGIVSKQAAPFVLKKEPDWKNKKMFGINWAFDAKFVPKDVYETIFHSKGVESMQVLLWKKSLPMENVVQLVIPISPVTLRMDNHPYTICDKCGQKKYDPQDRGLLETFETSINAEMIQSKEFFGSGASAFRKTIVSKKFRRELMNHGVKMQYFPMKGNAIKA